MANYRSMGGFSIHQLESLLHSRRAQIDILSRQRVKVMKKVASLDEKIRKLGGSVKGDAPMSLTASGRARNPKSLVETMRDVLGKTSGPMSVGDIVDAVQATGYRSNSASFRAIVNQTLIKERKAFTQTGRGMYGIKK